MAVFYAVMVEVDPNEEAAWNDWHTRQHIPDVLAEPGFVRATKYRLDTSNGDWHQYLTVYELASREALDDVFAGRSRDAAAGRSLQSLWPLHAPVADDSDSDGGGQQTDRIDAPRKLRCFR